ncbi:hypothetical protein Pvag_pPag20004 (plasmid) [Pantoea vagans C9-1]|nr:hypothetical protein Pvag_pPag20004 [Pantoea vagans C9-1]
MKFFILLAKMTVLSFNYNCASAKFIEARMNDL